jgi:NAD-dependent dihydropyrimidine dehydrogenase PreA subunit
VKTITTLVRVDRDRCTGCGTCEDLCPVEAISVGEGGKAWEDDELCMGCGGCEQRCPEQAISVQDRPQPRVVAVSVPSDASYASVVDLCLKAKFHPEQVICYCTGTRAEEIAAAILFEGAVSPEQISSLTGARTGCKVECIEPMLRLLKAAGCELKPPSHGHRWYGLTTTAWELPAAVVARYQDKGFCFSEDLRLLDEILSSVRD